MTETDEAQSQAENLVVEAAQAHFNQGLSLHQQRKFEDAERIYREILRQLPYHFDALLMLGVIAAQTNRAEQGVELMSKAIGVNAKVAIAHINLGNALSELKRFEEALASYDRAIALQPPFANAYNYRGIALRVLKRREEALASYNKAIALQPDYAEAYNNRGNALSDLKRPEEALASYDRAIALQPDYAEAYINRGVVLQELKRSEEAIESYGQAMALRPVFPEAHFNQSQCLLLMGRFEQGWRQYEWRRQLKGPADRAYPQPLWLGEEDIAGKTLFIYWEQGLGDTIQFCRYAKLIEARGAKVIISVQESLHVLLQQTSPNIQIMRPDEVPANFDYHCPLLSLPLACKTTLETIPAEHRYMKADEKLRAVWSARLPAKTKPRIAVVWCGSANHKNDHNRSIELEQFFPIFGFDADWMSLQKEISESDLAAVRRAGIAFFGDDLRDFSDTAALLDLMDLVITIDTSVAHLAGALGKPVWILLPFNPDWRWLLDRNDSPWYPSARLFRQQQIGNWAEVIDRVKSELRSMFPRLFPDIFTRQDC